MPIIKYYIALLFCLFLSSSLALKPTVQKQFFTTNHGNSLSYELYQTRNGIISHSIEKRINNQGSHYLLIDVPSREAKPILTDLVQACELEAPNFESLHYHTPTDSPVFFCSANNSLLILDQSDYTTIQATIPFNLNETWPNVRLSTDGMNVAVLLMGDLFTTTPRNSALVRVSLQTKEVITQISFNQGFSQGEAVVAFASNKKAAYVATNKADVFNFTTTVYFLHTLGNTYQVTPVTTFSNERSILNFVTKLFCVGSFIAVSTNHQEVKFIDHKATITTVSNVNYRAITVGIDGYFHLAVTSQYGHNDIYIQFDGDYEVFKYTVTGNVINSQKIGNYCDMKIAYGNQASGDLMFALESNTFQFFASQGFFSIINLQTLQPIYHVVVSHNLMVTNTTYATVLNDAYKQYYLYIFDLKNDTLIAKIDPTQDYYYNQEQQIISFLNYSASGDCSLNHIDLARAKIWTILQDSNNSKLCTGGSIITLRMTEHGNPEFILSNSSRDSSSSHHNYIIYTESYGFIDFSELWVSQASPLININWDLLTFNYFNPNGVNQTNATLYTFDSSSKQFKAVRSNLLQNIGLVDRSVIANQSTTVVLSSDALTIINDLGDLQPPQNYYFLDHWERATSFKDHAGNQYFIVSGLIYRGVTPKLFVPSGDFVSLPGVGEKSDEAQATGPNSYMVVDVLNEGVSLVKIYDASLAEEKTLISV